MTAYYNENNREAAAWLRELIKEGHIAPGEVDERDIRDVHAEDLRGFTQCHFFAGVGTWSYALRIAGWPDNRSIWTGSCPCQPFSQTGRKGGFADERHLWPAWYHLIRKCRPREVFGEQVASEDGLAWLDLVQSDLEAAGYAVGPLDLCAAGVGAPHIRQRLWIVARHGVALGDSVISGLQGKPGYPEAERQGSLFPGGPLALAVADGQFGRQGGSLGAGSDNRSSPSERGGSGGDDLARELADSGSDGAREYARELPRDEEEHGIRAQAGDNAPEPRRPACLVADAPGEQRGPRREPPAGREPGSELGPSRRRPDVFPRATERPGPVNGFWRTADWIFCRDGKWRAVEPGSFPLVDGASCRVGLLRGYGNGIVTEAAAEIIGTYLDIEGELYGER